MKKQPFFIIGIGRSGTTLIRLMLHHHPEIAIPYESHFITDYYRNADQYGDLSNDQNLRKLVEDILQEDLLLKWDHQFDVDRVLASIELRTLSGVFDAIYSDYANGKGKQRWGDKSDYLDRVHIINKVFPNAKFIHIVRDGRDVANSVMKMTWGPKDIIQAAEWWHSHIWLGIRIGSVLGEGRYLQVHYESLVENSEEELKRICEFLGEDYSPQMLEYYKDSDKAIPEDRKGQHYNADSAPKRSRSYAWKKEMSSTNIAIFNLYAHHSLKELGYEIPNIQIPKIRLAIIRFFIFTRRIF